MGIVCLHFCVAGGPSTDRPKGSYRTHDGFRMRDLIQIPGRHEGHIFDGLVCELNDLITAHHLWNENNPSQAWNNFFMYVKNSKGLTAGYCMIHLWSSFMGIPKLGLAPARPLLLPLTNPLRLPNTRPPVKPPEPPPSPITPLPNEVLVRIIMRSVRMLGRLTFGATTPQASLRRLLMEIVHFLERWLGVGGGRVYGLPKLGCRRLWWFGAISNGRPATTKSS